MATRHGVYVSEVESSTINPIVSETGVPYFFGVSPIQAASDGLAAGGIGLAETYDEAVAMLGYSDDWESYPLCEAVYSHFKIFGMKPAVFCNVLDVTSASHTESVAEASFTVTKHQAKLPICAIDNAALVVKKDATTVLVKDTDYTVFYSGENLVVELLETGSAYSVATLLIAYTKVKPESVTIAEVTAGLEGIEYCATQLGTVPDLIVSPKYSATASLSAAMGAKADSINGLFKAKALIDLDCSTAVSVETAITKKAADQLTLESEIVCWPLVRIDGRELHLATVLAGLMAKTDSDSGTPYESPSNKAIGATAILLPDTTGYKETRITFNEANELNAAGIVTALNFVNGYTAWGNYTACWPDDTEAKDCFIPVSRMFGWVGNTLIRTFWSVLDRPMSRRLIDTVVDTTNVWLNGLVGSGVLLGASVEFLDDENPLEQLMAGHIVIHICLTPPSPMQEIDFVLEYDASYVASALKG